MMRKCTWLPRLMSLVDSADLSRLEVDEGQDWLRLLLKGKGLEIMQHLGNLENQDIEGIHPS